MKTTDHIPQGKLKRAAKIIKTGLKVGKNYASYYGEKIINPSVSKDKLDRNNATDIMDSLQELKGGGLKVAQMLSMEEHLLPSAYVEQFSLAQFSVPPISAPLVKKTFKRYFGKPPEEVYDRFDYKSRHAASIGQVHEAWKDGMKLAVKIQYPGVGTSIQSDLALLKPMASRLLKLNVSDTEMYFKEVESKLVEETDYLLELNNSMELSSCCSHMPDLVFPTYLPEYSNERIITMEWIDGQHLSEYAKSSAPQSQRNRYGQLLWDFYMYQVHELRKVHADPHPGNILVTEDSRLGIIDFGCVKELPQDFYEPYARLQDPTILEDQNTFEAILTDLDVLRPDDHPKERAYFYDMFYELIHLALTPYRQDKYDFSNKDFFVKMSAMGERLSRESLTSEFKPNRGSKHFIYVNRTFFGLYNLLHLLKAEVHTAPTV